MNMKVLSACFSSVKILLYVIHLRLTFLGLPFAFTTVKLLVVHQDCKHLAEALFRGMALYALVDGVMKNRLNV